MCVSCTLVSRVFFPCHDAIPSSRVFFRAITHGSSSTSLLLVQHDRMHSTLSVVVPTIATYAYSRIVSLVEETVNWRIVRRLLRYCSCVAKNVVVVVHIMVHLVKDPSRLYTTDGCVLCEYCWHGTHKKKEADDGQNCQYMALHCIAFLQTRLYTFIL